jgi:hypothetical protein
MRVILLYSEALLRGSSNLGRANCSGRGTGAVNLGLTIIFKGSTCGPLEEWIALSWVRCRQLHPACAHRLAAEGATLPTSQQDITLLALLSLDFLRVDFTLLCIRFYTKLCICCYILELTQSINVWVQVISHGKSRLQLRSLNRGRLRETGNGVSISDLCSSIDLLQLMVSAQLHAAVL